MPKIDAGTTAAWLGGIGGLLGGLVAAAKVGSGYPAYKARRAAKRLQAAKELIARDQLEQALPMVVGDFPHVQSELSDIKTMLTSIVAQHATMTAALTRMAATVEDHTLSDTQEFTAMKNQMTGIADQNEKLSARMDKLEMGLEAVADLHQYLRDWNGDRSIPKS